MEDVEDFVITYEYTRGQVQARIRRALNKLVWKYHDLDYVADVADEAIIAPAFVKNHRPGNITREEYEKLTKGYHEYSIASLKKGAIVDKKVNKHADSMEAFFEEAQKVYPGFCQNMESKVPEEDYSQYMKYREKLRRTATEMLQGAISTSPEEAILEYQDKIAEVIDSEGLTKACKTEDEFVLAELDAYLAKVANLPSEERVKVDSRKIETDDGEELSITQFAERMKQKREERIALSNEFLELYDKKKLIKFELIGPDESEKDASLEGNKATNPTAPGAPGEDGNR